MDLSPLFLGTQASFSKDLGGSPLFLVELTAKQGQTQGSYDSQRQHGS